MRSFRHRTPGPYDHQPDPRDLHICLGCEEPFVVPEEILSLLPGNRYLVRLRCMNCDRLRIGVFDEDAMTALDLELSRAQEQIRRDAELLGRALFAEEIEAFADRLRTGRVMPEDF